MPWDSFDLEGSDPDALDGFKLIGRALPSSGVIDSG